MLYSTRQSARKTWASSKVSDCSLAAKTHQTVGDLAVGTKVKGPAAGVAAAAIGVVAHDLLDVPLAVLLLKLGLL